MESILAAIFDVESEGYQAITMLSRKPLSDSYGILQMSLVKRVGKTIIECDSFQSGAHTTDDTHRGGVIGSLLGVLGGPIGVILLGSTGALAGSVIDARDAKESDSLLEKVAQKLDEHRLALIALVTEENESELDTVLGQFKTDVLRFDAAAVAEEVEEAEKLEKEMERQARQQLRESKKAEHKKAVEKHRAKIKADFEDFKAKFKK